VRKKTCLSPLQLHDVDLVPVAFHLHIQRLVIHPVPVLVWNKCGDGDGEVWCGVVKYFKFNPASNCTNFRRAVRTLRHHSNTEGPSHSNTEGPSLSNTNAKCA
jgi:hypothetical protein